MKPVFAFFEKLLRMLRPQTQQVQSQRMCPFCGLITRERTDFVWSAGSRSEPFPLSRKMQNKKG